MLPKIAAVLGAHTELGKRIVRELLRSPLIQKVHALAEVDPRDGISLRSRDEHKLVLHLDPLDYIEETVSRWIPRCDLAFCVLGCGRKDMAAMGAYKFHKTNLDIPRRFIHEMFTLGVQRIALLSHAGASPKARSSEFLRVKGELESIVRELQTEAGERAPGVTIFKVPLVLTSLRDASGIKGTSITTVDKVKQKAAVKLDLSPAHAVHVRDVALAMVVDMFHKLHMAEASSEIEPAFRRRDIRYDVMDGRKVVDLANQHRAMLREQKSRFSQRRAFDERISGYARRHTGRGSDPESSVRYGQSGGSAQHSGATSESWKPREDDSNESYMSGTPPDEDLADGDHISSREESVIYHDGRSALSHSDRRGLHSPRPSSEPRPVEEGGSDVTPRSFRSPERRGRSKVPVTSVEALGDQLGRRLTVIRDNEYLPDTDSRSIASPRRRQSEGLPYQDRSSPEVVSPPHILDYENLGVQEFTGDDFSGERRDLCQAVRSRTSSLPSPPSRPLSFEIREDSPVRDPEVPQDSPPPYPEVQQESRVPYPEVQHSRFDSLPQRYSAASYDRAPSRSRRYTGNGSERYSEIYGSGARYQREPDYRGGIRSEADGSKSSSMFTRVTAFAERIIAATDRPSMKQRNALSQAKSFRGRDRFSSGGLEPVGRETTI